MIISETRHWKTYTLVFVLKLAYPISIMNTFILFISFSVVFFFFLLMKSSKEHLIYMFTYAFIQIEKVKLSTERLCT